jgi:hypothetical protein
MSGNTGHRLDFTQVSNQVPLTIQLAIYPAKGPLIFSDAHGDNVILRPEKCNLKCANYKFTKRVEFIYSFLFHSGHSVSFEAAHMGRKINNKLPLDPARDAQRRFRACRVKYVQAS